MPAGALGKMKDGDLLRRRIAMKKSAIWLMVMMLLCLMTSMVWAAEADKKTLRKKKNDTMILYRE